MTASRDQPSGEIILKVVNSAPEPKATQVQIEGARPIAAQGTMIVLTSGKLTDENSIAEPKKVAPVTSALTGLGASFRHIFAPYS